MSVSSKVVLVTGGARRIGARIVSRFHGAGYRVVIHCNASMDEARELEYRLNQVRGESAVVISQDLADSEQLSKIVEYAISTFGRLDCLVNNASIFYPTSLSDLDARLINQFMDINLKAPLLLSREAAEVMNKGAIINIVDIYGENPLAGYLLYSVSKAALQMLTRGLALELAPDIRVNGVSPGAILWPEDTAEMSEQEKEELLGDLPMGRLGEPDDIAKAAFFLAEDAGFVTGQVLSVDGGQSVA
jgi:pteridine reductase